LNELNEMPRINRIIGLERIELPDFTIVCARMQTIKMPLWRDVLRLSAFTNPERLCSPQNHS
jgi:hypothetical protein